MFTSVRITSVSPPELSSHEIYVCSHTPREARQGCNMVRSISTSEVVDMRLWTFPLNQQRLFFLAIHVMTFTVVKLHIELNVFCTFSLWVGLFWSRTCLTYRNAYMNFTAHIGMFCMSLVVFDPFQSRTKIWIVSCVSFGWCVIQVKKYHHFYSISD